MNNKKAPKLAGKSGMNKCRISKDFLSRVHTLIGDKSPKDTKLNRRALLFIKKWDLTKRAGFVYHNGRQVVPIESTEAILKQEAVHGGMPLSRDGAYNYLSRSYVGFKKKRIMDWLSRVESIQLNKRRTEVARSKSARPREGATNWRMSATNEGRMNLGVDLFQNPKEWTSYPFFFVGVLQKTGYTWVYAIERKSMGQTLGALKKVFLDCEERFGAKPSAVTSDNGGEFKNKKWTKYLQEQGVKQKFEKKLCSWVEKKNSQFGRAFAVLLNIHRPKGKSSGGYKIALRLALEKINNTVSRKTRRAAVDWKPEDFLKRTKRYNKKIAANPKRKIHRPFALEDRVRLMQKQAVDKGGFYKSYEGTRSKFHRMWSEEIYNVTKKKSLGPGFGYKYKINDEDQDWIPQRELQLLPPGRLIHLQIPKKVRARKKPKSVSRARRKFPPKSAAIGKMKRGFPPKATSVIGSAPPALRRSTRVRRKPVRYQ